MVGELQPRQTFREPILIASHTANRLTRRRPAFTELNRERQEVIQATMPSVVTVGTLVTDGRQIGEGIGSGFVIESNPNRVLIATNIHVEANSLQIAVQASGALKNDYNEQKGLYKAEVVYESPNHDIAFLAIDPRHHPEISLQALKLGNIEDMQQGSSVLAFGAPYKQIDSVTDGIISKREPVEDIPDPYSQEPLYQTTAPINPGMSGGPVVDPSGDPSEVIGMVVAKVPFADNMGYFIPVNSLKEDIERFKEQENFQHNSEYSPYPMVSAVPVFFD